MRDLGSDPAEGHSPRALQRDHTLGSAAAFLFSISLGVSTVAVPLLAVRAGHGATAVGMIIALAAISQVTVRLFMGAMMRALPDKTFIIMAAILIATSCGILVLWSTLLAFVVSQLVQGASRAFFWTGSQTHAVRASTSAVGALTLINLASGAGSLIGPTVAGILASSSLELSLAVGASIGVLAVIPSALLVRFRPFRSVRNGDGSTRKRIWRRPGVDAACWMGVTSGSWRGLLNSYVPVVLAQAGQTAAVVGFLVSVANAASLLGSAGSKWVRSFGKRAAIVVGVLSTGVGMAAVGFSAHAVYAAAVFLAISGIGAGVLQTVGPALAAEAVDPEERGEAIASTGTFRAVALFLAPMGMAGMVLLIPTATALFLAGLSMTGPALIARRTAGPPS